MKTDDDIDRAEAYLRARRISPRLWIYWADETAAHYVTGTRDMRRLGAALRAGRRDAYSLWCAEGGSREAKARHLREAGAR